VIDDTTVLGLFKTRAEAEAAVSALQAAGFEGEDIGLLAPGELHEPPAGSSAAHGVATGTAVGGVAGGILGALAAGLIPGVGPFVAGGYVWTGFDYRGEPTPYAWPCTSRRAQGLPASRPARSRHCSRAPESVHASWTHT